MRPLACLLAAAALAGCGGERDRDEIVAIVQAVARDYGAICERATARFLQPLGGRKGCRRAAREDPDDSAAEIPGEIDVRVEGDRATATFTDNRGRRQEVSFAREDGGWKVDAGAGPGARSPPGPAR